MTLITQANCGCAARFMKDGTDRRDPTGTTTIRLKWEREVNRRFRALSTLITRAMVTLDVMGLVSGTNDRDIVMGVMGRMFDQSVGLAMDAVPPRYAFARSANRVNSFMAWLEEQQRLGILEIRTGTAVRAAARSSWQNVYIDSAYQKGIRDTYGRINSDDPRLQTGRVRGAFNRPIHADRVGLIYTRAFESLVDVNRKTAAGIRGVLAEGMAEGRHPREIARRMVDRVDKIGIARARTIARTETIAAHAEASLNSFREAGIEGVNVVAEFATAGDDEVCPECEALEGREYSLDEASGIIPVHPNCRCTFIPSVKDGYEPEDLPDPTEENTSRGLVEFEVDPETGPTAEQREYARRIMRGE